MNHRNRSLLDLAHELHDCTNCGRFSPDGLEPAHQNGISAGKGMSIKSGDFLHAALCGACHMWYDRAGIGMDPTERFHPTREEKREMWLAAYFKTANEYWKRGWLTVA